MDIERTVEFILQQQATFSAQMDVLGSRMGEMQSGMTELRSLVVRLAEQQLALTQHVDHFQREISAAVLAIAEAQRHTDERLNALISVVNGLVRGLKSQ